MATVQLSARPREWTLCIDQIVASVICCGGALALGGLHRWLPAAALFTSAGILYATAAFSAAMAASREVRGAVQAWFNPVVFAWRLLRLEPKGSKAWKGLAAMASLAAGAFLMLHRTRVDVRDDIAQQADYRYLRELPTDIHTDILWTPAAAATTPKPDAGPGPADVDAITLSPILSNGAAFTLQGTEGAPPKQVFVGILQPMAETGPNGGGVMHIQRLILIAPRGRRAVLGGLPSDHPPDVEMAPILIEDSMIDTAIELGPNVRRGRDVVMIQVTHLPPRK